MPHASTPHGKDENSQSQGPGRIVWAVDVFDPGNDIEIHLRAGKTLRGIFPELPIHPIYVLSEEEFDEKGFKGALRPGLKPMAERKFRELMAQLQTQEFFERPRVLMERTGNVSHCANHLIRYLRKINAGLVAVDSHTRNTLSKLFVGSFIEELIDHSPVPVLVSGPNTGTCRGKIEAIVFPTDFSASCHHAFLEILKFARWLRAEIHLFHKPELGPNPILESGIYALGGAWISWESFLRADGENHDAEAEAWMRRASHESVVAHYICEKFREPVSNAIVEYVKTLSVDTAMIAMTTHTGPIASAFLGSVTRDVIKQSPCPVYLVPRRN